MFDQNLSLLQPGGEFNVIWLSGDPVKKKISLKLKKKMTSCDLDIIISQLQPYIFNLRKGVEYDRNLAIPLNVAHRLVYGTLKCLQFSLDEIERTLKRFTSIEMSLLQKEKALELSEQVSRFLLGDEGVTEEMEEIVTRKKRKHKDTLHDTRDIDEIYNENVDIDFGNLRIQEPLAETPVDISRFSRLSTTMEFMEKSREREKRKREFTELFDIISEVGKTNEDVVEVAREAFSANPILADIFERRITGDIEGIEAYYDQILDDKAAQTELYLQKLKFVDKNVINEECIAEVSRRSGKRFSIKADKTIPQDIYTELTSIAQGTSTLFAAPSTFQVTRGDLHEGMDITAPEISAPLLVPEVSEIPGVTFEELFIPSPGREPIVPLEVTGPEVPAEVIPIEGLVEEEPVTSQPAKRRRVPGVSRPRQPRSPVPSSLDVVASIETLEELIQFFNRRKASSSLKVSRRIKLFSKACENLVNGLTRSRGSANTQESKEFSFWFRSLEDISEESYVNNGIWMNMFDKLQELPFTYSDNGFIIESSYNSYLKEILKVLSVSKIDYALYGVIVDMPIIGMSNNPSTKQIITNWLGTSELEIPSSQMSFLSDYKGPTGKSYDFLPKFLPLSYLHSDFTLSLRTLSHPYEKLKYSFLKKISQERALYHRNSKLPSKKIQRFAIMDIGSWNIDENIKIIEKMLKDVVLSDKVLTSKIHNLEPDVEVQSIVTEVVKTLNYNPCGVIAWSDLTLFVDSLFKFYCEIEEKELDESSFMVQFLTGLFGTSERKSLVQEKCSQVEYKSRLQEIHNSLIWEYKKPENYFYNDCNEKVNSKFKSLLPTLFEDETSVFEEIDMEDIITDLETFELETFLGYIPAPVETVQQPVEETTFERVCMSYENYRIHDEDLRTKLYYNTQIVFPTKWDELLASYPKKDRKRPNGEPPFPERGTKRPRISISLSSIPEEGAPIGEEMLKEISELPEIEEVPEREVSVERPQSSVGSYTFKTLHDMINNNSSQYSVGSVTFKTIESQVPMVEEGEPHLEPTLPLSPTFEGREVVPPEVGEAEEPEWMDVTVPLPELPPEQQVSEISELISGPSAMQSLYMDERRKEVEEILKRQDVVPEYQYSFFHSDYRYGKKIERLTEDDYKKIVDHQMGRSDLFDIEEGPPSDYGSGSEASDLFKDLALYNYSETSEQTYEKIKRLTSGSKKITFEELIKDCPRRPCVAKTLLNVTLLGRGKKYIDVYQKYPDDIKITIRN